MAQQSLTFDTPTTCGWCLHELATTMLYNTPSCPGCAATNSRGRVQRWLTAVKNRITGQQVQS